MAYAGKPGLVVCTSTEARYFPRTSLLDAEVHPGISYTWRSILKGIALLKEGLIVRVGNATSINIWRDAWIARDEMRTLLSHRGHCLLTRVCELIDPDTQAWNEDLVRAIFKEEEGKIILATPLRTDHEDVYAWHFDSKGMFSVISAYKVYVQNRDGGLPSASTPLQRDWEWKELWRLPCQPKIQQFMWRLAHNSLRLKLSMKRRGIDCDTLCLCCRRLDEDGAHLFLKCKTHKSVWRSLQLERERQCMCECKDAGEFLHAILKLTENKRILVVCMLWCWWTWRNKLNVGDKSVPLGSLDADINHWAVDSLNLCGKLM